MLSQSNTILLSICISGAICAMEDSEDPELRYEPYSIKRFPRQREEEHKNKEDTILTTIKGWLSHYSLEELEKYFKKETGNDLWEILLKRSDHHGLFVSLLTKEEVEANETRGVRAIKAARFENDQAVATLIDKGAIISKKDGTGSETIVDDTGNTILIAAVQGESLLMATEKNVAIVAAILNDPQGAALINCQNASGENALLKAVKKRTNENYLFIDQIITLLVQHGEVLHVQENSNEEGAFKDYLAQPVIFEEEGHTNCMKNLPTHLLKKIIGMVYENHPHVRKKEETNMND